MVPRGYQSGLLMFQFLLPYPFAVVVLHFRIIIHVDVALILANGGNKQTLVFLIHVLYRCGFSLLLTTVYIIVIYRQGFNFAPSHIFIDIKIPFFKSLAKQIIAI